ncbi:RES family NAD+ phosphorylase [Subtercola lobariae]|uniref:RES family NAD+ phosphorylase n=1 Tax=Subtercola lobariae TaxID=1588641 RepID=UPI001941E70D
MVAEPQSVTCPSTLWRVGRSPVPLHFSSITPIDAARQSAGNRFDVPGGGVLYAASSPSGAFAETLARFRPTTRMRSLPIERDEHLMAVGGVPADWRTRRQLVSLRLRDPLPF